MFATLFAFLPLQTAARQAPIHIHNSDSTLAVKVTVDGSPVDFKGAPPQVQGAGSWFRCAACSNGWGAARLGAQNGDGDGGAGDQRTVVAVGKRDAMLNGQVANVETPPIVAEGRVMVPLRFLAQALGAKVEWLGADRTVAITTKEAPTP